MARLTTTTQLRAEWHPPCRITPVIIGFHGSGRAQVRQECAEAFRALNAVLVKHDYRTRRADTGGYNCRTITGGSGHSPHSYGVAVDINWQTNPYGKRLVTDMPQAMVNDILAITTNNGVPVFRWGGHYSTNKDAMHFEVMCQRRDLASGIRAAAPPAPSVMRKGSRGEAVRWVQAALNSFTTKTPLGDRKPLAVDGVYGPRTAARVMEFERWANGMTAYAAGGWSKARDLLHADGVVTDATLARLAAWRKMTGT